MPLHENPIHTPVSPGEVERRPLEVYELGVGGGR